MKTVNIGETIIRGNHKTRFASKQIIVKITDNGCYTADVKVNRLKGIETPDLSVPLLFIPKQDYKLYVKRSSSLHSTVTLEDVNYVEMMVQENLFIKL